MANKIVIPCHWLLRGFLFFLVNFHVKTIGFEKCLSDGMNMNDERGVVTPYDLPNGIDHLHSGEVVKWKIMRHYSCK